MALRKRFMYVHIHMFLCVDIHVCVYTYVCISTFIHPNIDIFIYVSLHTYPSIEREFKDDTTLGSIGLIYDLMALEFIRYDKTHTYTQGKQNKKNNVYYMAPAELED